MGSLCRIRQLQRRLDRNQACRTPVLAAAATPDSSTLLSDYASSRHYVDLWSHPTSSVRPAFLDSLRMMHRASFSHRNPKSYIVVVYVPGSLACASIEAEVERLAEGLRHEPRVSVTSLNALASKEHFEFSTSVLEAKRFPTIYLYPEGTPGYMRFKGDPSDVTAESLLSALNGCYKTVMGSVSSKRLELRGVPPRPKEDLFEEPPLVSIPNLPVQLQEGKGRDQLQQKQFLAKADRPHHLMVAETLKQDSKGYWIPEKIAFWSFVAVFSFVAYAWDAWGDSWWAGRRLAKRMEQRKKGVVFDEETELADFAELTLLDSTRRLAEVMEKKAKGVTDEDEDGEDPSKTSGRSTLEP